MDGVYDNEIRKGGCEIPSLPVGNFRGNYYKNCYKNELRLTKYSRMDTNTDNKILMFEGRKP